MRTAIRLLLLSTALIIAAAPSPPAIADEDAYMAEVVETLASPVLEGRKVGTSGHFLAAYYLAGEFQRWGLLPLGRFNPGDSTSDYFHFFPLTPDDTAEDAIEAAGRNIVAWLPGTESADPAEGCFIVSAHYDHAGLYADESGERRYFPGANDNASGVAVVLNIAKRCAEGERLPYPTLFALFDAEEQSLLGSYAFVGDQPVPLDNAIVINLDMVGGLNDRDLLVAYSVAVPDEHPGMFFTRMRDIASAAGLGIAHMRQGWEASDQFAFYQQRVPFIFLFGGPTADYERLTDTPDRLDYAGLERIADFTWNLLHDLASPVSYGWLDLGEREPSAGARRGFLGVVPDFSTEADEGVVIAGTVPGSPAEKAGLLEDDVILEIDRRPVHNLQALADILRDLTPGDEVEIVYRRAGVERRTRARIVERNEEGA